MGLPANGVRTETVRGEQLPPLGRPLPPATPCYAAPAGLSLWPPRSSMIFSSCRRETEMAKLRRDNHYVPECYQKGFADSNGRVWIKPAGGEPEHRNPSSVGKKLDLYVRERRGTKSDEVERFFDENVERQFASLSQRVKGEQNKLSAISTQEVGALARFVASQAVRTLAHKQCIIEQAGHPVDTNTFVRVSIRQIWTILSKWIDSSPAIHFYTSLPQVGDRYITGDHPVLTVVVNESLIWSPRDEPRLGITNLEEILANPRHQFMVSLSPYVCASIRCPGDGNLHLPPKPVDPRSVRLFNDLVRRQCKLFTLARDEESLI